MRDRRDLMLDELLAEFGIGHLRRTPALALSGGERRRVEIARALATQPAYILLDEPLAGIDPIAVGEIRDLVSHLKDRGIGVLITDHNVRETLGIIDRAYIMHDGQMLMEGRPRRSRRARGRAPRSISANGSACSMSLALNDLLAPAPSMQQRERPEPRMALGPRLDLRQTQTLVMTPQLRQAIKLLQYSNIEVASFVEEELERNPLLERDDSAELPDTERAAPDQMPERISETDRCRSAGAGGHAAVRGGGAARCRLRRDL